MMLPPGPVRVLVAMRPVDFRKGMDGLAAYAANELAADPFSGTVYVFRSRRADMLGNTPASNAAWCSAAEVSPSCHISSSKRVSATMPFPACNRAV